MAIPTGAAGALSVVCVGGGGDLLSAPPAVSSPHWRQLYTLPDALDVEAGQGAKVPVDLGVRVGAGHVDRPKLAVGAQLLHGTPPALDFGELQLLKSLVQDAAVVDGRELPGRRKNLVCSGTARLTTCTSGVPLGSAPTAAIAASVRCLHVTACCAIYTCASTPPAVDGAAASSVAI